jgi:hypothetical protein
MTRGTIFPGLRRRSKATSPDEPRTTFAATPKQVQLMNVVTDGRFRFIGFGGGIRGTKTYGCLAVLITLCRMFPRSRWAIVRKDLPTIRRNVVPSFNKIRADTGGFVREINRSEWIAHCANGSEIIFFPELYEQDPELERWKGLEVNGFLLEEGSELNEKSANKSIERAGSWVVPPTEEDPSPKQPPPFVLVTFNPCKGWPRKWFYEPWKAGTIKPPYFFLPTTIADNPFAGEEYKESLKYLPPEEYRRFVLGEWDFVDDPDQLIKSEWIWNARNVEPKTKAGPAKLGVDVARYGDDFTTIARQEGNALVNIEEHRHLSTDRVADIVALRAAGIDGGVNDEERQRAAPVDGMNVHIDSVGLGAGTVDSCRRAGLPVREFNSSAAPVIRKYPKPNTKDAGLLAMWQILNSSTFKFKNIRSQAWWEFREKLRLGLYSFSLRLGNGKERPVPEKLVADLAAVRYTISGDKVISVESKDDIKKRLGRSTDDGDAVVMVAFDFPPDYEAELGDTDDWKVVKR